MPERERLLRGRVELQIGDWGERIFECLDGVRVETIQSLENLVCGALRLAIGVAVRLTPADGVGPDGQRKALDHPVVALGAIDRALDEIGDLGRLGSAEDETHAASICCVPRMIRSKV